MTINPKAGESLTTQAKQIDDSATEEANPRVDKDDSTQRRKQLEILDIFGTIDIDPAYDYKKNRQLDSIEHEP